MSPLLIILLVFLLLSLFGGGFSYRRYGYGAWSPLAVLIVILLVLVLTGNIS